MAVYVDNMEASFGGMIMCHMIADTLLELMEMADLIGVQRRWIQKQGTPHEHFDICKSKRKLAVEHGAIQITAYDLAKIIATKREQQYLHIPLTTAPQPEPRSDTERLHLAAKRWRTAQQEHHND